MRAVFWLLPFAAMTAGASQEIIVLILGRPYVSAALPMALLIFAALSMVMIAVTTSILTAAGKPGWTFAMTGPLIPLALLGHILLIPRWGLVGASLSTTLTAIVGALATMIAVYGIWRVRPRRKMGTFVQNVHSFLIRSSTSGFCPDETSRVTQELVRPKYRATSAQK